MLIENIRTIEMIDSFRKRAHVYATVLAFVCRQSKRRSLQIHIHAYATTTVTIDTITTIDYY